MVKKKTKQALVILTSLFLCAAVIFGATSNLIFLGASENILNAFAEEATIDNDLGDNDENSIITFAEEDSDNDNVLYLSDRSRIKHDSSSFSLGNSRLWMAPEQKENIPNKVVQAKIEGAWYTFEYGVYAHASSLVVFDISKFSNEYKYFSTYVGLTSTASQSNGVIVRVDFSQNGSDWTTDPEGKTPVTTNEAGTQFVGYNQNYLHLTYDVTGVKWIRLFANKNGSDAQDQVLWTDAKLTTAKEEGGAGKALAEYDNEIKAYGVNADLNDKKFELLLLQREFVSRVGQYALKRFTTQSGDGNADNKAVLDWLLNDLDSLREFMLGGTPFGGSYYNSLTVLAKLYKHYKNDLKDTRPLKYNKWVPGRTYGELYRTMMFSVALTHDKTIGSYLQASRVENQSDPLRRYAIYRYMYETERFVATRDANGNAAYETMNLFGSLKVEEMRWIMSNIIDDESIIWLNDYVQTRINANPKNAGNLHTPHSYVRYTDPNYNNPVFYADENYAYFNQLFQVDGREAYIKGEKVEDNAGKKIGMWDTRYEVPAGEGDEPYVMTISRSAEGEPKLQKVWMNFNNKFKTGSVCGGISKSGCNIRGARGVPANVIGQPGHAAILYLSKDANGNGSWKIDNDVGGWLAATKGERHLLAWGSAAWQRNSSGTVVYFHLAQECLNDYDNLVKAEEYCWLAKVYQGDLAKQEELYEKALKAQSKNLDAWYGLLQTYKANNKKTVADYSNLTSRIADTLWNHPVPMHCLFRLLTDVDTTTKKITGVTDDAIDAVLKNPAFTTQIKAVETAALQKAKTSGSSAAKSKVNYLLGIADMSVADFSFDGENAGCIVWSDTYSDSTFTWKYSLDGKKTWKEVTFNEGDSHAYQLTEQELSKISTENDIYVYIVGASPDNAYKIDVAAKPTMPDTLYANDWENRVIGVDGTYEWRYVTADDEGNYKPATGWISYAEASPDCSGNKAVEVRLKGTAKKPASDSKVFTFTADKDTAERKYISISYLSMEAYSTQSQDASRPNYAVNAIDGNAKTYWHTDYTINIKLSTQGKNNTPIPRVAPFLVIKLEVPRWISALEFSQRQYNSSFSIFAKNVTVYVSEDGENWKEAGKRENLENAEDLNAVHFEKPVYGQYVKLVMDSLYETNQNDGIFTTVSLINIYEDTTQTKSPGGEVMPSLSEITPSGNVFAGLGGIISEEEALIIGNKKPAPKSYTGLWVTLAVAGSVLVAAAVVFVLYKRGIIKFKDEKGTTKGSKSKTNAAEPKANTAKSKTNTAQSTANTAKPKTSTAQPTANAAKSRTSTVQPRTNTAQPTANAAKSRTSTVQPTTTRTNTVQPRTGAAQPTANTAKPRTSTVQPTTTRTNTVQPRTGAAQPTANTAKPRTSTVQPTTTRTSTVQPRTGAAQPTANTAKPRTGTVQPTANTNKPKNNK